MLWMRDNSLTLVMLVLFAGFAAGQTITGWHEYNSELTDHGRLAISLAGYFRKGHFWEALFENWESEFLQMAAFVTFTTVLYQIGSPESRRPAVIEPFDLDPREFSHLADAPWPVRRGGWVLKLYEHSLGLALFLLFAASFAGHAIGGWSEYATDRALHHQAPPTLSEYVQSNRFWFESLQNWQSEFLSVGAMVWLSVYLRQRYSPESKAVYAPHGETGR